MEKTITVKPQLHFLASFGIVFSVVKLDREADKGAKCFERDRN